MDSRESQIRFTRQYKRLQIALIVIAIGHIIIAILYSFNSFSAIFACINELFCVTLLAVAICMYQYCVFGIYVIIVGINFIMTFCRAGLSVQHDILYGWDKFHFIVYVIALVFYLFGLRIGLSAYKEFKFIAIHGPRDEPDEALPNYTQPEEVPRAGIPIEAPDGEKKFKAFSGKGVPVS